MMKKDLFRKIFGQAYIWLIMLLMYLPILVLIAYSFSSGVIGGKFTFTWDLYEKLFHNKEIMVALGNTLLVAVISAVVSTVLGTFGAIGAFYSKAKMRQTIDLGTQIPVVNAEIVVAFSLTVMFVFIGTKVFGGAKLFSFWTLLIGHVCLSLPFVYISVKPKLQQMDPSLYEAAMDLGASPSQALRKVLIPEVIPGIISGFLLAITLSLDDFIITRFLSGPGLLNGNDDIVTLSTYIQDRIRRKGVPMEMRAMTTIIFLGVIIAVILVSVYRYKESKKVKVRKGRIA